MTSIQTNNSAIQALQTLRAVNAQMATAQSHVSSGLKIETAADNAAYWSISTSMRSDNLAISTVIDALGLGAALVDVAYSGMASTIDVLNEMKAKLVAAKETGVDKAKIQSELEQLKQQAFGIATSSSFNGVNWLNTDESDLTYLPSIPVSFPSRSAPSISTSLISACSIPVAADCCRLTCGGSVASTDFERSMAPQDMA